MFSAAKNPALQERVVECTGEPNDLVYCRSVAPAAKRIICLIIEGDIQHGTQIEIEPEQPEQLAGQRPMESDEWFLVFLPELLSAGRLIANQPESRNPASFLINRNDRLSPGKIAQVINKLSQLRWRLDVAAEKNVATGLHLPKNPGRFRVKIEPGNTDQE